MQHHFVGDVGDFGKYGLLRAVTGRCSEAQQQLTLGVIWYLNHRKAVEYLDNPDCYSDCDPCLFDELAKTVSDESRRKQPLDRVEASEVLGDPALTDFYRVPIPSGKEPRERWWKEAHEHLEAFQVVFLDPDNSLKTSTRRGTSPRHAYLDEVEPLVVRGQTAIIYQSYGRNEHTEQMAEWRSALVEELKLQFEPVILRFDPAVNPPKIRAFIILPAKDHAALISERLDQLLTGPWGRFFSRFRH